MTFLESLGSPADLRRLDASECDVLAKEIRDYLITTVSGTGGHLGPNLGVVELTMGLHRTFDSPRDTIIFDVGHQTYVHKLLTGRRERILHPAAARRTLRLPEPVRERPRRRREFARLHVPVLGRWHRKSPPTHR
jgi:deoxyxylulose-5-phosphate synthase